ncbi:MAG: aminotransferase class I/II-fold pyridoxal phosphate-dependent enzyme [Methylococcaceae bacterium]
MTKHGGDIYSFAKQLNCLPEQIIDFSANINPQQAVNWQTLTPINLSAYAEPHYNDLKTALRQRYPHPPNSDIEVFNGASAAIFALLRHLKSKNIVLYAPLYGEYSKIAQQLNSQLHIINRFDNIAAMIPAYSTIIFVNPSTPDGRYYPLDKLLKTWQAANCTIIIDESFLDFCDALSVINYLTTIEHLYIIKSLSKFYGCAGIRIGFISASIQAITALKQQEPAWKLSSFDMAYMQQALTNKQFITQTQQQTSTQRRLLHQVLSESNLFDKIYPSEANFILARLKTIDGNYLQAHLAKSHILIRLCDSFQGLSTKHIRFAVKDTAAITQLARSLSCLN